ncbi:hypothetical protein RRG08_041385 [Elysia crispata]|uniref:Uncharacterized protein n=1 Tax=Elysia crispata TaxID=231223 RepID=A0AAE0XRI7_9GAST|nr:hypothetical protein RRG08_041385 [Elysia crispata]
MRIHVAHHLLPVTSLVSIKKQVLSVARVQWFKVYCAMPTYSASAVSHVDNSLLDVMCFLNHRPY